MTRETDPDFVYIVYINAPPEKIWAALTDNKTDRVFWANTRHDSTFRKGDPIRYIRNGKVDIEGEILEVEPGRRLVYTFAVPGPGPMHDEGPTTVEYLIDKNGPTTRLTVTHTGFSKVNSLMRHGISQGWPAILSSLKTILEGGQPLQYGDWGEGPKK
jgi:uncharacterized protein YndB with AHSA1/START domain